MSYPTENPIFKAIISKICSIAFDPSVTLEDIQNLKIIVKLDAHSPDHALKDLKEYCELKNIKHSIDA